VSADGTRLPFRDSRRLTGPNPWLTGVGAVLELPAGCLRGEVTGGWAARVARATSALGWRLRMQKTRLDDGGVALAVGGPRDLLWTAAELNEWAVSAALREVDPERWQGLEEDLREAAAEADGVPVQELDHPPVLDDEAALARLQALAVRHAKPRLLALRADAERRGVPCVQQEGTLTLGYGSGGRTWEIDALPAPSQVPWGALRSVPLALVTGSNGKTTTVRLVVAVARAAGWVPGHCCTDGVTVGEERVQTGDWSGPLGARAVVRDQRVEVAVLEAARGGILRRGLAVEQADAAIITNISDDHLGEYGIGSTEALADVKWVVASALGPGGRLVLPADEPMLVRRAVLAPCAIDWFAPDADHPGLTAARAAGARTCGVRAGRLLLTERGAEHDLGAVDDLPLACGGLAGHNLRNLAGAALLARGLGLPVLAIRAAFRDFARVPEDNPGRLERWERGGVRILVDYAHNPDGLRVLGPVVAAERGGGRLVVLVGQAGNRTDAEIEALTREVLAWRPDLVVVKEMAEFLRGRPAGEVSGMLARQLRSAGMANVELVDGEEPAACRAVAVCAPGDLCVLLVHTPLGRERVGLWLRGGGG
jgi:UDP-N-acetylmuramyl tripeptide synthase